MYKKAVTFIELVIIVAIVGIMTSVLLVSTSGSRTDKALEAAAREVAATIREAQNYALTGKGAGSSCGNRYTFEYFISGNDEYKVKDCYVAAYSLKNGVIFQAPGGSFNFSVPYGTVSILLANSPETITLTKGGSRIKVCVYSSGKIVETDIGAAGCP